MKMNNLKNENLENQKETQAVDQQQSLNNQKIKTKNSLRIVNIFFLCLVCIAEIFALIFYTQTIQVSLAKDLSVLAILALLPMYVLITFAIFILAIIMSIIAKSSKKQMAKKQQRITFFDKFMGYFGWIIILINVVCFFMLYII